VWNRLACTALVAAGCLSACSPAPEHPPAEYTPPHQPATETEPQPVASNVVVVEQPGPAPVPEPLPSFDPATVTELTARISVVHNRGWAACGIIHSVGAIEVEVLDVGEPPPRMALYISCPADIGRRVSLAVGEVVRVSLFSRKQSWPKPLADLPDGLVVRYVESIERASRSEAGSATDSNTVSASSNTRQGGSSSP
jgi:hypothetical protein